MTDELEANVDDFEQHSQEYDIEDVSDELILP